MAIEGPFSYELILCHTDLFLPLAVIKGHLS